MEVHEEKHQKFLVQPPPLTDRKFLCLAANQLQSVHTYITVFLARRLYYFKIKYIYPYQIFIQMSDILCTLLKNFLTLMHYKHQYH
jgi:hypothetical protein